MLDGIIMEKLSRPAAVICTEPFLSSGKAMAAAHGFPDYPFVLVPHPINATANTVLDAWITGCLEAVKKLLVKG